MNIKKKIQDIIDPVHSDSNHLIKYLRSKGIDIGDNTYFFSPKTFSIDTKYGMFIKIGKNCKITKNVTILAHDYSYSVLREKYHEIPKKAGLTYIGDNVFIGINSIILMGSHIGNNVIIGAGSVVSGKIPDNEVWGGNPAKFICTLDEYYKKCTAKFEDNAALVVKQYQNKLGRNPSIKELETFSLLFINNDKSINAKEELNNIRFSGDNKEEAIKDCLNYKSKYNNYDEFIKAMTNNNTKEKK